MNGYALRLFAVVLLSLAAATSAFAADDGNTQPKLSNGGVGGGVSSPQDIVSLTSGAGNVKGYQCSSISSSQLGAASINIYVNGGSAQTLYLSHAQVLEDSASNYYTAFIPLNVRFTSSIKVQVAGNQSGAWVDCTVSWGLD
jgi:hypothetical protein